MKKRILSMLLVAIMLLTLVPMSAFATGFDFSNYCLCGYINGADYGTTAVSSPDFAHAGDFVFSADGKLTATFTADSYVQLKREDGTEFYAFESYVADGTKTKLYEADTCNEKMFVPANTQLYFTLTRDDNGFFWLSYSDEDETPAYTVTNGSPEADNTKNHGYITIDKETAAEGDTVTVKVNPAEGYQLKSLTGTGMQLVTVDPSGTTAPNVNAAGFGGSTVRNGNFLGHNFDYYINGKKEVVIKTESDPTSRPHAVIGVANPYSLDVTGTAYDAETLKQLAWLITDGINDAGLVCSINGVSTADIKNGPHTDTNNGAPEVMVLHLVREILDFCGSVPEAKTYIEAHDITPLSADWDAHIMIADENSTVIVEFTGEGVLFVEQNEWIMTDFYNHLFKEENFLRDNSINNFPKHANGMERYYLLDRSYATAGTKDGMAALLKEVTYTKTYDKNVDPFWCSEFYRTDMIPAFDDFPPSYWTKEKVLAQDAPKNLIEKYAAYEADGTFDPTDGLKHTAHSSVYNIKDKTLTVSFGNGREFIYTFNGIANPEVNFALQTDGTYQFTMPGYAVIVTAEFEKAPAHTHDLKKISGQAATEEASGWKDYYKCDCGKFFEDATCKVEITDLNAWKAAGGNGYIAKLEEEPKSPQTGDNSHMALWVMLLALSSMGLCACGILGKKRKNEQ